MARSQLSDLTQRGAFARMQDVIARRAQRLDELVYRMGANHQRLLHEYGRRLEIAAARIRHFDFRRSLAVTRTKIESGSEALARTMRVLLATHKARLNQATATLQALSPLQILDRGYALIFDRNGALLKDAAQLAPGEEISARVAKGSFTAEVKKIGQ
jgi:exodeoxyribonuclease VII large subunit